jgi:hypothetical protein
MPITPFLRNQVFQPEQIGAMSEAFTCACTSLGLADHTDPIAKLVANHIIQLAQMVCRLPSRSISAQCESSNPTIDHADALIAELRSVVADLRLDGLRRGQGEPLCLIAPVIAVLARTKHSARITSSRLGA